MCRTMHVDVLSPCIETRGSYCWMIHKKKKNLSLQMVFMPATSNIRGFSLGASELTRFTNLRVNFVCVRFYTSKIFEKICLIKVFFFNEKVLL